MKVAFDYVDPEAKFFGMKKLNFHSMNNDKSMLRERLGYSMFREQGLAAPRAVHARLTINGKLEGLFALIEQVDGRFTRSRFTEGGKGNLYKEVWPMFDDAQTYLNALETNRDESPSAQRMLSFKSAIGTSADAAAEWIDRDYTLKYLAADRVIINDDGIFHWWCAKGGQGNNPNGIGNHNYYWYEAALADHLWLVPWDMDFSFNTQNAVHVPLEWRTPSTQCACVGTRPASCDPLVQRWIEWSADYETAVDAFIAGPFAATNVDTKLSTWSAQIQSVVTEAAGVNGAPSVSTWQNEKTALDTFIDNARANRGYKY
jgi:spore coat protein CotH